MRARHDFLTCGTSITSCRRSRAAQRPRAAGRARLDRHGEEVGCRQSQATAQWELKRSVSTAYYALFHAVAKEVADLLAGAGPVRAGMAWRHAYRGLEHGVARNACREVPKLGFSNGIAHCAREFVVLQEARHDADYDPTAKLTRAEALEWVARAEAAIAGLRTAPRRDRRAFAIQVLLKKRS